MGMREALVRGIRAQNGRLWPRFLVLAAVLIYITLFSGKFASIGPFFESFDGMKRFSDEQKVKFDPVGDAIGQPSLDSAGHVVYGKKAMVSCDVPLCSTYGKRVLLSGGNAADAAVAVALCIGSINSHSSGIGGGGFIVSSNAKEVLSIDAREMAPEKAHKHMFDENPLLAQVGGLAVGVPGELKGLYELFRLHGLKNVTWAQVIEPIIELNEAGWPASEIWIRLLDKMNALILSKLPIVRKTWDFIFKNGKDGELVQVGDVVRRPNLANTLRLVAQNGLADVFYDPAGPIVPHLVKRIRLLGGIVTEDDFSKYEASVEQAVNFNFTANGREYVLHTSKGVSLGIALVAGLDFYTSLKGNELHVSDDLLETHRVIESMKWIASARTRLGDQNETYTNSLMDKFSSLEWPLWIKSSGKYSDNHTFPWQNYEPEYELTEPRGTSYFAVVDENGNSVGMTTTVNLLFGLATYDNVTGVVLNNEMDDFSLPEVPNAFNLTPLIYNWVAPFKRPLSLSAPTIISVNKDGILQPELLIGAAGGSRIPTAIFQAIVRTIFHLLPLAEAILYPRFHHQLVPEFLLIENYTLFGQEHKNSRIIEDLAQLGHSCAESGLLTAMNGIKRALGDDGEEWHGVSDYWRKRGRADGY